jgi:hypothetical protein
MFNNEFMLTFATENLANRKSLLLTIVNVILAILMIGFSLFELVKGNT